MKAEVIIREGTALHLCMRIAFLILNPQTELGAQAGLPLNLEGLNPVSAAINTWDREGTVLLK